MPCRAAPRRAAPRRAAPRRAVPCRAVPCRAVPCRAVPCSAVQYSFCRWAPPNVHANSQAMKLSPSCSAAGAAAAWPAASQRLRMRVGMGTGPVELSSQRPASTAVHCSTVGQATAAWSSMLWAHSVKVWRRRRRSLHFPANVSAKKLALPCAHPSGLAGLERGLPLTWASCFITYFPFFHHSLKASQSAVTVMGRREPCAACESGFLLKRCPFCCPLGVNQGHGTIILPRMGGLARPQGGQWDT